jgi:hypothetical protein
VKDGWRESSRPELLGACRLQRAADRRTARTRHPHAIVLDGGVEVAAAAVLLVEGVEVGEQVSVALIAHTAARVYGAWGNARHESWGIVPAPDVIDSASSRSRSGATVPTTTMRSPARRLV